MTVENSSVLSIKKNCDLVSASMVFKGFPEIPFNILMKITNIVSSWIFPLIVDFRKDEERMNYVRSLLLLYSKDMIRSRLAMNKQLPLESIEYCLSKGKAEELEEIIPNFSSQRERLFEFIDVEIKISIIGINLNREASS